MFEYAFESELVKKKIRHEERLSGRDLLEYRPIEVEIGRLKNADGSAIVRLGNTEVIAGVKAVVGEPFPDMPNEGSISVGVEMTPMADPTFESGPPDEKSIELARVVDRGIRESKAIDFEKLCLVEGEKVWVLFLDIYVVNNHGNMFDAASIAALAALNSMKFPKLDEDFKVVKDEKEKIIRDKPLKLNAYPILFTFAKIEDKILLDPDLYEDAAAEARFSVAITENGNVSAMQKGIGGSFTPNEILNMIKSAKKKYKEIAPKVIPNLKL